MKTVTEMADEVDSEGSDISESYDSNSDDDVSEGYYVGFCLLVQDAEQDEKELTLTVNFGDEDTYTSYIESGLEVHLEDIVEENYTDVMYLGQWEECDHYGSDLPVDFTGDVHNID